MLSQVVMMVMMAVVTTMMPIMMTMIKMSGRPPVSNPILDWSVVIVRWGAFRTTATAV